MSYINDIHFKPFQHETNSGVKLLYGRADKQMPGYT